MKSIISQLRVHGHWRQLYTGSSVRGVPALIELVPDRVAKPIRLTCYGNGEPSRSIGVFDVLRSALATAIRPDSENRKAWSFERSKDGTDEWLTPPYILQALGEFDLDPCAPLIRPWNTARHHCTILHDGLTRHWAGRVFCNPPYGRKTEKWLRRCSEHGDCIVLIFARTETRMFHRYVWNDADAVFFFQGRLRFFHVNGTPAASSAGAPSCLVAYGLRNVEALAQSGLKGKLIVLRGGGRPDS